MPVEKLRVNGALPHWAAEDRLTQRQTKRPAFEITLSVPKSVSLLLNAGDTRINAVFDESVERLMARVEDEAFVRVRGEERGQDERQRSSSLLWTAFKHETSRPVRQEDGTYRTDPHRHLHIVLFNTTRSAHASAVGESKLYALDPGVINERIPYLQAAFNGMCAEGLQKIGYGVHRRGRAFEVDGVTPEMVHAFSERTQEINEYADELGLSAKQKGNVGALLRERKGAAATVENMRDHMSQRKPEMVRRLDRVIAEAETTLAAAGELSAAGRRKVAEDAVNAALGAMERSIERGLERKSTAYFDRFMEDALIHAVGRATEADILAAVRERKGLYVELDDRGERYNITTQEVLDDERGLIASMQRGRGAVQPLAEFVDRCERLNEKQQAALDHVMRAGDRVTYIRGRPGVGKSWVIGDLNRELQDRGVSVIPLAPTAAASRGALRQAKLDNANTLAAFLDGRSKEADALRRAAKAGVIVLDEAGMAATADLRRLFEKSEQLGARVVCIGDTNQLGTVARGDGLRLCEKHGLPSADIDEILRQEKNETYKAIVEVFSNGDAIEGLRKAEEAGYIVDLGGATDFVRVDGEAEAPAEAMRKLAAARAADEAMEAVLLGKSFMTVVPTHAVGAEVAKAIRGSPSGRGCRQGGCDRAEALSADFEATGGQRRASIYP